MKIPKNLTVPESHRAVMSPPPHPTILQPDWLMRRGDVMVRCGISETMVKRLVKTGRLPVVRLGRRSARFRASDVARLVAEGNDSGLIGTTARAFRGKASGDEPST